ncbi:hypothetical protein [Escherichia coli]
MALCHPLGVLDCLSASLTFPWASSLSLISPLAAGISSRRPI